MILMNLVDKKCVPCEGEAKPFTKTEAEEYLNATPGWRIDGDALKIDREFEFPAKGGSPPDGRAGASGGKSPFEEAMMFVNKVAELAESEGHHPDIHVFYNRVKLVLSTHAIGGLSENDFILAAKIDRLF